MSYIKPTVWKLYHAVQYNVYYKCGKYNCISVGKSNNVRSVYIFRCIDYRRSSCNIVIVVLKHITDMSHFKCLDKYIIMTQPIGRERESQAIYTHHIVNSESQCGECRINKNL